MKNLILFMMIFSFKMLPLAQADDWMPRLSCEGADLVIDGLHSLEKGFTDHQLVIRDNNAVAYLGHLANGTLLINQAGEAVVDLSTANFDTNIHSILGIVHGATMESGTRYAISGKFIGDSTYQIQVTSLSVYPGMSYSADQVLGNWVFYNCHTQAH